MIRRRAEHMFACTSARFIWEWAIGSVHQTEYITRRLNVRAVQVVGDVVAHARVVRDVERVPRHTSTHTLRVTKRDSVGFGEDIATSLRVTKRLLALRGGGKSQPLHLSVSQDSIGVRWRLLHRIMNRRVRTSHPTVGWGVIVCPPKAAASSCNRRDGGTRAVEERT